MTTKAKKQRRTPRHTQRLPRGPQGGIELLLIHSVDDLGHQGDVVEVRPGYAINHLLPQGLATLASDHHKRMVDNASVEAPGNREGPTGRSAQAGGRDCQAERDDRGQRDR